MDEVTKYFKGTNQNLVILNTEQIGEVYNLSVTKGDFRLTYKEEEILNKDIRSIWIRKPHFAVGNGRDKAHKSFAYGETRHLLLRYCDYLEKNHKHIFFVNKYSATLKASDKIQQIFFPMRNYQVSSPPSLITSSLSEIREFYNQHNGKMVIKSIEYGNVNLQNVGYTIYTTDFTQEKLNSLTENLDFPLYLQRKIEKVYELRITVIGSKVYAVRIDPLPNSDVDLRTTIPQAPHSEYQLPEKVKSFCLELNKDYGLQYSSIDIGVDQNGQYYFFEINPSGQYLWLEKKTSYPLSRSIYNLLTDPERN